jgi:Protein of unknown function (DUF3311)
MLCSMALEHKITESAATPEAPHKIKNRGWLVLLVLPYIALCFPSIYARATPALFGFPFFYWYQFLWVVLASMLMFVVYRKVKY